MGGISADWPCALPWRVLFCCQQLKRLRATLELFPSPGTALARAAFQGSTARPRQSVARGAPQALPSRPPGLPVVRAAQLVHVSPLHSCWRIERSLSNLRGWRRHCLVRDRFGGGGQYVHELRGGHLPGGGLLHELWGVRTGAIFRRDRREFFVRLRQLPRGRLRSRRRGQLHRLRPRHVCRRHGPPRMLPMRPGNLRRGHGRVGLRRLHRGSISGGRRRCGL